MAPGSLSTEATEIFQEGLQAPGDQADLQGRADPLGHGDHQGQFAHAGLARRRHLGGDRLGADRRQAASVELAEKYGVETFENAMSSFMDFGEQVSLTELAKLPKGTFELSEEQDDGRIFNVTITISDTEFVVDLRDNPDQSNKPAQHQPRRRDGLARR